MANGWSTTIRASEYRGEWTQVGINQYPSHPPSPPFSSYVKNKIPRQGQLYLSLNNLCFYAYLFGRETKFIIRYSEMTDLSRGSNSISIRTKNNKTFTFGLLFSAAETYNLIEQLSKMAMQRMIHDPDSAAMGLGLDHHSIIVEIRLEAFPAARLYSATAFDRVQGVLPAAQHREAGRHGQG